MRLPIRFSDVYNWLGQLSRAEESDAEAREYGRSSCIGRVA